MWQFYLLLRVDNKFRSFIAHSILPKKTRNHHKLIYIFGKNATLPTRLKQTNLEHHSFKPQSLQINKQTSSLGIAPPLLRNEPNSIVKSGLVNYHHTLRLVAKNTYVDQMSLFPNGVQENQVRTYEKIVQFLTPFF